MEMISKQDKINLLSNLIAGKVSAKEVIKAMPRPLCIAWSWSDNSEDEDNPETYIYVANGKLLSKHEFDRAVKWRVKHG